MEDKKNANYSVMKPGVGRVLGGGGQRETEVICNRVTNEKERNEKLEVDAWQSHRSFDLVCNTNYHLAEDHFDDFNSFQVTT